jgi:FxsC-like protein
VRADSSAEAGLLGEPDGVARAAEAFARAAPAIDAVTLSEALWLAAVMPDVVRGPAPADARHPGSASATSTADDSSDSDTEPAPPADGRRRMFDAPGTGPGVSATLAAIGTGRALPSSLDMARALRPFKRRWSQGRRPRLDLEATVTAYARTGRLLPVFGPAPERWFEAAVVVDASPSMASWHSVATELVRLADHTGVFRTVRRFDVTASSEGLSIRTPAGRHASPAELLSPDGRRLTLVFSDFSSGFWHEAAVWSALRQWATHGPTAAVSPLPQRLWRRTGLNLAARRVFAQRPGDTNHGLLVDAGRAGSKPERRSWVPVPVVSLTPPALAGWARVVMHLGTDGCDAVLLPPGGRLERPGPAASEPPPDVNRQLANFLTTAPDPALRLAVLCTPFRSVSLPLLNLLRQTVDQEVTTADLAEVVLSGLFTSETDAQGAVVLELRPEARDGLAPRLTKRDVWRSYDAVSRVVESVKALPGRAVAAVEDGRGLEAVTEEVQPFAGAHRDLLVALGAAPKPKPQLTAAIGPSRPQSRPLFFLSYAHVSGASDEPDLYYRVRDFYRDLCNELALADPGSPRLSGFMDDELVPGAKWAHRLVSELAACNVFIPLYSPGYFASNACGREWAIFQSRQTAHAALTGRPHKAIVPVLWKPVRTEDLPAVAAPIQTQRLPGGYSERGLYELIRRGRDHEYAVVVRELAARIGEAARTSALPRGPMVDFGSVQPAFPEAESTRLAEHPLRITVAAPVLDNLPPGRDPEFYGRRPQDWRPFHPDSAVPLAVRAADFARRLGYTPIITALSNKSPEPEPAVPDDVPGLLLIDPWVAGEGCDLADLAAVDRRRKSRVRAVIPWSATDPQTTRNAPVLRARLRAALPQSFSGQDRADSDILGSLGEFSSYVARVIGRAARDHRVKDLSLPNTADVSDQQRTEDA